MGATVTRRVVGILLAAACTLGYGAWLGAARQGGSTGGESFDAYFIDKTMRVDYFHSGGRGTEIFGLDRVVSDGPWAGSRTRLVDDLNLGKYLFEVVDRRTNRAIYSRGFASIYGEWETTPESRRVHRTFHESLRFPWPRRPVQVVLKVRDAENSFHEVWSTVVDPESRFVNPADRAPMGEVWAIQESGPPAEKVDLLVIGEGYVEAELPKFHADARRLVGALFEEEPFRSRRSDFNVWGLDLPSASTGISRPRALEFRRTPLSAEYNIFDSERYLLTYDNRALRDAASAAPYEFLEILVNEAQYGGGGIFNFQATAAADTGFAEYVFVHEFGHHFAGLADEYYTSDVAYETGAAYHPGTVGAERHGAARSGEPQVGRPGRGRHAAAHALGQGGVRAGEHGSAARARVVAGGGRARERAGRPLHGADGPRDGPAAGAAPRRPGGRVRGCVVRADRPLPLRGRLHHVHTEPGGVLPGLPAGHHARHRPVLETVGRRQGGWPPWTRRFSPISSESWAPRASCATTASC